jgi:hypothetical protein
MRQEKDDEIRQLQDLIEDERRKSMMDEKKVRELQSILESKMREANEFNNKLKDFSRKS